MGIAFNGTTGKLQLGPTTLSGLSYPISIFCWMKPNSATTSHMVAGLGEDASADNAFFIFADGGGDTKVKAFTRDSGSSSASSTSAQSTAWQPALAVFTNASSRTIYYASGAAVTDTTSISPNFSAINRLTVGCRNNDTLHFAGELERLAIWSGGTALGQTQFDALAAGDVPDTVSSGTLWDYWALLSSAATHTGVNGRVLTSFGGVSNGGAGPPVGGGSGSGAAIAGLIYNSLIGGTR